MVRAGESPVDGFVLTGPSTFFARLQHRQVRFVDRATAALGFDPTAPAPRVANAGRVIAQGRQLFLNRRSTAVRLAKDEPMSPSLSELLNLPAGERAALAMALWESLSEADREGELGLTPEEGQELDRRWLDHLQRPETSIPWDDVRRRLMERE